MELRKVLEKANEVGGSDIHFVAGRPPMIRIDGELLDTGDFEKLMPAILKKLAEEILSEDQYIQFKKDLEYDFAFGVAGLGRYRANIHMQRGTIGITIRVLSTTISTFEELNLPETLKQFTEYKNGLVLVTGPTGSGKTTTLAAMIDKINDEKAYHIITIEDPIEYLHSHKKSVVEQREIRADTDSFKTALKYILRQDPDVILVGEMRDLETIEAAITAAETGHLVFGTLHTNSASKTIDRIIDVFPRERQAQIRSQLSTSLRGVIAQQLIPLKSGKGRRVALEVLVGTPAIGNLIREGKIHQIQSVLQTGARFGMITMDRSLEDLFQKNLITRDEIKKRLQ